MLSKTIDAAQPDGKAFADSRRLLCQEGANEGYNQGLDGLLTTQQSDDMTSDVSDAFADSCVPLAKSAGLPWWWCG